MNFYGVSRRGRNQEFQRTGVRRNIHEKECVASDIQTSRSELKNEAIAEFFFLTNVEVLGYLMKHYFRVYDIASLKRKSGLQLSKFYAN